MITKERDGTNGAVSPNRTVPGTEVKDRSRYKSVKVTARAKHKLDLLAAAYQVPLTQLIDEMTDEWWSRVVKAEGGIAPDCATICPLYSTGHR